MKSWCLFLIAVLIPFAFSCGAVSNSGDEKVKERLRVVNAAATFGKVTILQNDIPILEDVSFGTASEYVEIAEDTVKTSSVFSVRVNPEFILPVLAVKESVVGPYKKTLLVTESAGQPVLTFIADQTATPLPSDESRIRFINAASTAKTIDVYVTSPSTSLKGRSPIASKLDFLSTSSFFPTAPGDYRIRVAVSAGTTTTGSSSSASTAASSPASSGTASSSTGSSSSAAAPDIDFDTKLYPIDSGEELSFFLLESKGGGRPYRSLTVRGIGG